MSNKKSCVFVILSSSESEDDGGGGLAIAKKRKKTTKTELICLSSSDDEDDAGGVGTAALAARPPRRSRRFHNGRTSPTDVKIVVANTSGSSSGEDDVKMGACTSRTEARLNSSSSSDETSTSPNNKNSKKRKRNDPPGLHSSENSAATSGVSKEEQEQIDAAFAASLQEMENNNKNNNSGEESHNCNHDTVAMSKESQEQKDAAYAASLQSREERARDLRKQRELESLKTSKVGKAVLLVEKVIALVQSFHDADAGIECVGKDDAVFLAEKMLECQDIFKQDGRPTQVCLGYHYTHSTNLKNIRADGLLTIEDRQAANHKNTRNIAAFGNGIYTATNPQAFTHFGDVGLLVAVLKGNEQSVGNTRSTLPSDINTVIGNKTGNAPFHDEIMLRASSQVLPLVKFEQAKILHGSLASRRSSSNSGGGISNDSYMDTIWALHEQIQHQVLDEYFNDSKPTTLTRIKSDGRHGHHLSFVRTMQTSGAAWNGQRAANSISTLPGHGLFALARSSGMTPFIAAATWSGSQPGYVFGTTTMGTGYYLDSQQMQSAGIATTSTPTARRQARRRQFVHARAAPIASGNPLVAGPPAPMAYPFIPSIAAAPPPPFPNPSTAAAPSPAIANPFISPLAPPVPSARSAARVARRSFRASQRAASSRSDTLSYTAPDTLVGSSNNVSLATITATQGDCSICLCSLVGSDPVVRLPRCNHEYHQACMESCLKHDVKCPDCRTPITASLQGKSPSGNMMVSVSSQDVSGYEGSGCIVIRYDLSGGTQKSYHQNPGTRYHGTTRVAYLPNNTQGQDLLKRLKYSFRHGLCFTVGTSMTTHRPNCIVWGSVHHKTSPSGGSRAHGFPDPQYFSNANVELDGIGVPAAADI